MKPHSQLTIVRNRVRARELRLFRSLVEDYFQYAERDPYGVPVDWELAQAVRSRINQMLPRIVQIVRAAGLGGDNAALGATDPGPALGRVDVLHRIFSARHTDGVDQEILDVLDMALGVYDGGKVVALARTFNPLHYAGAALAFVARGPRWLLGAIGLGRRADPARLRSQDVAKLEAVAARLTELERAIESRIADLQDRQALRHGDHMRQLAELAERVDFTERVLAQRPVRRLEAPAEERIVTPV